MAQQEKKLVYRAGLIPYIVENDKITMMFMRPSDPEFGGVLFQIAKGKIDDGEDTKTAAIREAREELGLFSGNLIFVEELGNFMGRTTIYYGKVKNKDVFGQPSFETSDVKWLTLDEFLETGRELHRPVVKAAYRAIAKREGIE